MIRKDDNPERTLTPVIQEEDLTDELNLRPKTFNDVSGRKIKENLEVCPSLQGRGMTLDHVLSAGLGTLARQPLQQ